MFFVQEMNLPCAEAIQSGHLLELLVQVLTATHDLLALAKEAPTPKYIYLQKIVLYFFCNIII